MKFLLNAINLQPTICQQIFPALEPSFSRNHRKEPACHLQIERSQLGSILFFPQIAAGSNLQLLESFVIFYQDLHWALLLSFINNITDVINNITDVINNITDAIINGSCSCQSPLARTATVNEGSRTLSTIQDRQGQAFDLRQVQRGVNFRRLRYKDIDICPNPIIHHRGVVTYGEGTNPMVSPESFDTYIVKVPKSTLKEALCCGNYTIEEALAPNSYWFVSNDDGENWIPLRKLGDTDRISPVRYHITLVRMGI